MSDIAGKISYLQGLSEGMNISETSPNGKIISGILSVIDEIACQMTNMQSELADIKEYVTSIEDDLFDLEGNIMNEEGFIEMHCQHCGGGIYFESNLLNNAQEDALEIICPHCNEGILINDTSLAPRFEDCCEKGEGSRINGHA